ncbi:MAG TPA: acylphosphatase, partial [Gaiellaceae bacterium]
MRERRRFRVTGVVQGVGFRPFVHGLARSLELDGFVLNDGGGVIVEAEGDPARLDRFAAALSQEAPSLAWVASVETEAVPPLGKTGFAIEASRSEGGAAAIPADVATCD